MSNRYLSLHYEWNHSGVGQPVVARLARLNKIIAAYLRSCCTRITARKSTVLPAKLYQITTPIHVQQLWHTSRFSMNWPWIDSESVIVHYCILKLTFLSDHPFISGFELVCCMFHILQYIDSELVTKLSCVPLSLRTPFSSTRISSASIIVASRWAMQMDVLFCVATAKASRIC